MKKRKAIKEMFKSVQAGMLFTLTRKGEPVAMVIPWNTYQELQHQLSRLGAIETGNVPEDELAAKWRWPTEAHTGEDQVALDPQAGAYDYSEGPPPEDLYTPRNEISDRFEPR